MTILEEYLNDNKDVTYPIHFEDSPNLDPSFRAYGFSDDGMDFNKDWTLSFTAQTRLVSSFTGSLYIEESATLPNYYYVHIKIFSRRPLNRIEGLPSWYPVPEFAKYGPFSSTDIDTIIGNIFSLDAVITTNLGDAGFTKPRVERNRERMAFVVQDYVNTIGPVPDDTNITTEARLAVKNGTLPLGVPLGAGEVLIRYSDEIKFSLHPADSNGDHIEALSFDSHFYFKRWEPQIENYDSFPDVFKNQVLAPPISTGDVLRVEKLSPLPPGIYGSVLDAIAAALDNDIILIMDRGIYEDSLLIEKNVSILSMNLTSSDITASDSHSDIAAVERAVITLPNNN